VQCAAALVLFFACAAPLEAAPWSRTFEGPNYGSLFSLVRSPDGDVVAVGATNHLHVPPYTGDVLLMSFTLDGDVLWETTWGGSGYEQAWAVAPAPDGGYFVFGETDSYGAGDRDFFLLKMSSDGTPVWHRTYGAARREWPYGMLPLANGDLLLYGLQTTESGNARRQFAVRVTLTGDVAWEYVRGEANEEIVMDAVEADDGSLIFCLTINEDGGLAKLAADGSLLWSRRFDIAGWQFPSKIAQAEDGFLLAGFALSPETGGRADAWLARTTSDGNILWEKAFGDRATDDYATSLLSLEDGTYLIGALGNGMPLLHVDAEGALLRRTNLAGSRVHVTSDLLRLDDGSFLAAGMVQIQNGRSYDAVLVRTDADVLAAPPSADP